MEKRIIVSITYQTKEQDFELPSGTPLGSLDQKLRDLFPELFLFSWASSAVTNGTFSKTDLCSAAVINPNDRLGFKAP